jgi:glycogen debranching enzyme
MRLSVVGGLWILCGALQAQDMGLRRVEHFPLNQDGLAIRRHVEAGKPFTVAGSLGVVLGQQAGTFEAWVLPIKLLSHFSVEAEVEGYSVPIDVNAAAGEIEVFPDHTTITYSHIAFTVKQTMFAPEEAEEGSGAVVLFQFDSVRPMEVTFRFTPEMRPMWPQLGSGNPSAEWVKRADGGFYVLHTDYANLAGAVAMPGTRSGVMAPYQEKPQVHPLELKLHYDPKRDGDRYFPLLMAVGTTAEMATNAALATKILRLNAAMKPIYEGHVARYAKMLREFTSIRTPDAGLNDAFSWAAISIEQLKAKAQPSGETGLVAGYYSSGDSARPGFGWFFGRDTLYTLYAVNGYGDFGLTREAMEFLIGRQREDGKMMHEYSQTAAFTPWKELSYMYAAADATPLFLTAMLDYVQASGDVAFLRAHREAVEKAWRFETTHDSDGDGVYDNSQGTGWVESWPTGMPHQEVYLALFDQQASAAMAKLATLLGDAAAGVAAARRGEGLKKKIEEEYYDPSRQAYAFSRNADGSVDRAATVYPMVAWWNGGPGLEHAEGSFRRWASHDFSTDWGLRDVAESDPVYDPISYHQGSVWPLFTGWAALAEYRTGRALAGYAHLMQNADQTTSQDLGGVTELVSGAFFEPFGRSTSHQLWSSAMVVVPALRGMLGVEVDGLANTVRVAPRLPADWGEAHVERLRVGQAVCALDYVREGRRLVVRVRGIEGAAVRLASDVAGARVAADGASVTFALPAVEVAVPHGLPLPGARTAQLKVLAESAEARSLRLELEGMGGTEATLKVRRNEGKLKVTAEGASLDAAGDSLVVRFAAGSGYQQQTVTLRW